MAKNYSQLFRSVMEILWEAIKLPMKNKKIFIFIILSTIISYILLFLAFILSLIPVANKLSMNIFPLSNMDHKCPEYLQQLLKIQKESLLFYLVTATYMFLLSMSSLLSMVSTVYMSAMSYLGKDLALKELLSYITQIWFRPLITWFFIWLISASLFFLCLSLSLMVFFARGSMIIVAVGVVLILIVLSIDLYLLLVSMISIVVSVLENCYGLQALGKAQKLIKEKKAVGLLLCFILVVPLTIVNLALLSTQNGRTMIDQLWSTWATEILGFLVSILSTMAYTVFYFDCKQSNGEIVDFEDGMQYSKISTVSVDGLALP